VDIVRDALGNIRQVKTLTRLADVQTLSPTHYAVTVYPLTEEPEQVADTGLYALPEHAPTRVLDVAQGESVKELLVGFQKGTGDMRPYRYVAVNGDWTLYQPSGLVEAQELYFTEDESGAQRLHTIRDETGKLWSRDEYNYVSAYWGYLITNRIEGIPGDATRTTSWSYYTDGPHKDLLRETVEPTGNRILYEYDDKNRVVRESMPLVEEETLYSYEPVAPSDPPLLCDTRPRCVVRKMQGVEIQRTYYVYGTNGVDVVERVGEQGAAYGGTNVLRTVTTYYPVTGAITDGLIQSVRHEDGTIDNYAYDLTDGVWTETITHVHEQAPDIVPMRTTRSVRVRNALGQLVDSRTDLCTIGVEDLVPQADWTPIERLQYAYDVDGNEIRREDLAGRLWTAEWAGNCCGKISETDWQGITTTYAYDAEGRVIANQTGSVLTETAYDALGRATNVARRGIATADRPAATVHPSSFAYDSLGRETMSEGEDGIRRLFSYSYRPEGGEALTVVEAPGTDCERVTTTLSDASGQTIRELRNGALRRTVVYAPLRETVYEGSKGTNSPLWRKSEFDLFGRIVRTRKPGFGDAILHLFNTYDQFGRIVKSEEGYTSSTSSLNTMTTSVRLFQFDEVGNLVLSADDFNRNMQIDCSSFDLVFSNEVCYVIHNGSLWKALSRYSFPETDLPTPLRVSTANVRLTGFNEQGNSFDQAILVSENRGVDIYGNISSQKTICSRVLQQTITTSFSTNSSLAAWSFSCGGVVISNRTITGVASSIGYDALGRMIAIVDGRGNTTAMTYDSLGRLATRTDATGAVTAFGYDTLGRRVSITNALGAVTTTSYDFDDNIIAQRGAQHPVLYSYDEYGRMRTMTTFRTENLASGDVTTWHYDEATGLLVFKEYADGKGPSYDYTPDGRPTRTTWARGAWFENVYDSKGRIIQVRYDDPSLDTMIEYDRLGRIISTSVPAASYRYALDCLGHATNEISVIDGVTNKIIRDFDNLGRQTHLRVANLDYDQSFSYDEFGRLAVVDLPRATVTYDYTPDSLDAGHSILTSSNAVVTRTLIRDSLRPDLITSVSNLINDVDSGSSFDYTYDAIRRPVVRNHDEFSYNLRNEIVWARYGTNALADRYAFDPIGNLSSNLVDGTWSRFVVNQLNEYTSISNAEEELLTYDPDGNLLSKGTWAYEYDSANRLKRVYNEGTMVASISYDAASRPVLSDVNSRHSIHLFDGVNEIVENGFHKGNDINTTFYWGKDIFGQTTGTGGVGGLLSVCKHNQDFYSISDNNGNIVEYVDQAGCVATSVLFDCFGNVLLKKSTENAPVFDHWYSSKRNIFGLYFFGFRFYDSELARWLTRDPINENGGQNLYSFVGNSPLQTVDPVGFCDGELGVRCLLESIVTQNDAQLLGMRAQLEAENPEYWDGTYCHCNGAVHEYSTGCSKKACMRNTRYSQVNRYEVEGIPLDLINAVIDSPFPTPGWSPFSIHIVELSIDVIGDYVTYESETFRKLECQNHKWKRLPDRSVNKEISSFRATLIPRYEIAWQIEARIDMSFSIIQQWVNYIPIPIVLIPQNLFSGFHSQWVGYSARMDNCPVFSNGTK
jgi:RHS repeat-associated protein